MHDYHQSHGDNYLLACSERYICPICACIGPIDQSCTATTATFVDLLTHLSTVSDAHLLSERLDAAFHDHMPVSFSTTRDFELLRLHLPPCTLSTVTCTTIGALAAASLRAGETGLSAYLLALLEPSLTGSDFGAFDDHHTELDLFDACAVTVLSSPPWVTAACVTTMYGTPGLGRVLEGGMHVADPQCSILSTMYSDYIDVLSQQVAAALPLLGRSAGRICTTFLLSVALLMHPFKVLEFWSLPLPPALLPPSVFTHDSASIMLVSLLLEAAAPAPPLSGTRTPDAQDAYLRIMQHGIVAWVLTLIAPPTATAAVRPVAALVGARNSRACAALARLATVAPETVASSAELHSLVVAAVLVGGDAETVLVGLPSPLDVGIAAACVASMDSFCPTDYSYVVATPGLSFTCADMTFDSLLAALTGCTGVAGAALSLAAVRRVCDSAVDNALVFGVMYCLAVNPRCLFSVTGSLTWSVYSLPVTAIIDEALQHLPPLPDIINHINHALGTLPSTRRVEPEVFAQTLGALLRGQPFPTVATADTIRLVCTLCGHALLLSTTHAGFASLVATASAPLPSNPAHLAHRMTLADPGGSVLVRAAMAGVYPDENIDTRGVVGAGGTPVQAYWAGLGLLSVPGAEMMRVLSVCGAGDYLDGMEVTVSQKISAILQNSPEVLPNLLADHGPSVILGLLRFMPALTPDQSASLLQVSAQFMPGPPSKPDNEEFALLIRVCAVTLTDDVPLRALATAALAADSAVVWPSTRHSLIALAQRGSREGLGDRLVGLLAGLELGSEADADVVQAFALITTRCASQLVSRWTPFITHFSPKFLEYLAYTSSNRQTTQSLLHIAGVKSAGFSYQVGKTTKPKTPPASSVAEFFSVPISSRITNFITILYS